MITDDDLIPAVAYLRMSSDMQDESIEQQRKEVNLLAAKFGYRVIRWYADSGKSGSLQVSKRTEFLRMIADSNKREFKAVLCWDVQRFGRLDPLKAAAYKDTLKTNGVHLHTVKEGRIEWNKFSEYVIDVVYSAAAHEYSKSLSKDTIRGRLNLLEQGHWPNGNVPFGYDKIYVSPEGKEYHVKRSETFKKGNGWERRLVRNEAEAKVIQFIFAEYVDKVTSMRQIARQIHVTRPDGKNENWTKDTVKATLTNKIYAGYAHIGGLRGRLRAMEAHNRVGYHEYAGAVDALVSLETWEKAQAKIGKNREDQVKIQPSRSSPLSGVLVCGHCGYRLDKHSRSDRGGGRYAYFTCSSAIKRPSIGCKQWRVREETILPLVIQRLVQEVDRAILDRASAKPEEMERQPSELEHLKRKLDELTARIAKGTETYLTAPDGLKKMLESKLNEWVKEREEIERQQRNLTITEGEVTNFAKWWSGIKDDLVLFTDPAHKQTFEFDGVEVTDHSPVGIESSRFRQLLKDLGFKVTLWWRPQVVTKKGRTYTSDRFYELEKAVIEATASAPSEHILAASNSKCSHVHSRDTD